MFHAECEYVTVNSFTDPLNVVQNMNFTTEFMHAETQNSSQLPRKRGRGVRLNLDQIIRLCKGNVPNQYMNMCRNAKLTASLKLLDTIVLRVVHGLIIVGILGNGLSFCVLLRDVFPTTTKILFLTLTGMKKHHCVTKTNVDDQ